MQKKVGVTASAVAAPERFASPFAQPDMVEAVVFFRLLAFCAGAHAAFS